MAYETASATGPNDLLDKLRAFALANGWTIDYHGPRTNAGGASQGNGLNALAVTKAGCSWVLYHSSAGDSNLPGPRIALYTYPGPWVASAGTDAQANLSPIPFCTNMGGPYVGYHFFTDSTRAYLHVAVEVAAGRFSHFHLGHFDRVAASGVAAYATALVWDMRSSEINNQNSGYHNVPWDGNSNFSVNVAGGAIRADSDGTVPRYLRLNESASSAAVEARGGFRASIVGSFGHGILGLMRPSAITGRAILVPCLVTVSRSGNENLQSILGTPYDLRLVRIDNLAPGEVMTIGSDQWKTFPIVRKNGPLGMENSANYGYAYRVVP